MTNTPLLTRARELAERHMHDDVSTCATRLTSDEVEARNYIRRHIAALTRILAAHGDER